MIRLVRAFNLYRKVYDIPLRAVARTTGVGKSTMTRFGQGKEIVGTDLAAILTWLLQDEEAEGQPPAAEGGPSA